MVGLWPIWDVSGRGVKIAVKSQNDQKQSENQNPAHFSENRPARKNWPCDNLGLVRDMKRFSIIYTRHPTLRTKTLKQLEMPMQNQYVARASILFKKSAF